MPRVLLEKSSLQGLQYKDFDERDTNAEPENFYRKNNEGLIKILNKFLETVFFSIYIPE